MTLLLLYFQSRGVGIVLTMSAVFPHGMERAVIYRHAKRAAGRVGGRPGVRFSNLYWPSSAVLCHLPSHFQLLGRDTVVGWIKDCGFVGLVGREVSGSRKFSVMVRS